MKIKHNFPTLLTLFRLFVSPLILPFLFVILLPFNNIYLNCALAIFFLVISLTDFFDGFLARRYKQVTALGALLDPIADKSLVCSTLIALVAVGKIFFYWAIVLIGREFFVMTLRLVACEHGFALPVSWYGKFKTLFQMAFITVVIINPTPRIYLYTPINALELLLLCAVFISSIGSAWDYYQHFRSSFKQTES
jgi:CDP-diacylglycerol--glycerol-3-phosphate 3-phosphatidyltransferase